MNLKKILFDTSTIVISVFCLFPTFTSMNLFRLLFLLASMIILIVSFNKVRTKSSIFFSYVILCICFSIIASILLGNYSAFDGFIHILMLIPFVFAAEFYRIIGIEKIKFTVLLVGCFLFISVLQTIRALELNPGYARLLSKNQDDIDVIGISGGYGLIYAALLFLFSTFLVIKKIKRNNYIIPLCSLIISSSIIFLVWKSGFLLALFLLIFGTLVMLLGVSKKNIVRNLRSVVIILCPLVFFQDSIADFAIEQTYGTSYARKTESIFASENSQSVQGGEFDERQSRYERDLYLLVKYPLIGCWQYKMVGKHSFILDVLAQFGLLIGAAFIYIVLVIPYRIMINSHDIAYTQALVFFGALVVFLIFNSMPISLYPIICFVFPFSNYFLKLNE